MEQIDDEQLLRSLVKDPQALDLFYRRHVGRVQAAAARRMANPDQVADVVANVFVAVIDSASRFDPGRGRALPWLYGIVAHVAAEERRRHARQVAANAKLSGHRHLQPDDYLEIDEQVSAARQVRTLYAALDALPDRDRKLIELISIDNLSPTEAAAVLGIRASTARTRLTRARRRLRDLIPHDSAALSALHQGVSA